MQICGRPPLMRKMPNLAIKRVADETRASLSKLDPTRSRINGITRQLGLTFSIFLIFISNWLLKKDFGKMIFYFRLALRFFLTIYLNSRLSFKW